MAFAPPRKAAPSPLTRRSPSCPAIMARDKNSKGSSTSSTARSIFTSTPTTRGRGISPKVVVGVKGKGSNSRILTTPKINKRRRSNSLDANKSHISESSGGFQNFSQSRQSTLIEATELTGSSTLSSVHGTSLSKVHIGGPGGISNLNAKKPILRLKNPVLQPKLSQNEVKAKQNEQKELELLKSKLKNARLKYLNTALLYTVAHDLARNKIKAKNIQTLNNTVDVGLVQKRRENMIQTCKSKYSQNVKQVSELTSLKENLLKIKDLIGTPEFVENVKSIDEDYSKRYDFIPIKNIEFDKENGNDLSVAAVVEECLKEMDLCSSSTYKEDKVPTVFSALSKSALLTEQRESIKKDKDLFTIVKEKLIEKESLKLSLNSIKR